MNLKLFDSSKSKFKSWVFSIAKNYMIDKWRCTSNTTMFNIDSNVCATNTDNTISTTSNFIIFTNTDNTISSTSNFTTNNIEFENINSINYISAQLSPQDFTLLDMKYIQGYDYCEIGKEFNVTSTTISNRVNYIKTKLKKNNSEIIYD